jgi:hypothetical protein
MAFTMACPNFKKGLKMAFDPLGVKSHFMVPLNSFGIILIFLICLKNLNTKGCLNSNFYSIINIFVN